MQLVRNDAIVAGDKPWQECPFLCPCSQGLYTFVLLQRIQYLLDKLAKVLMPTDLDCLFFPFNPCMPDKARIVTRHVRCAEHAIVQCAICAQDCLELG